MGRTELREKVDETVALRSATPEPMEPARVRSLSIQEHSKILRGVLDDGGIGDLTASARNELGKLYRRLSVLLAE